MTGPLSPSPNPPQSPATDGQPVSHDLDAIRAELRPNSGSSLRDAVDLVVERQTTIGREIRDLKTELHDLRTKTDDHIVWHLDSKE